MADLTIRPLKMPQDAEQLAELCNASDPAWPGTFTDGRPFEASQVQRWMEEERTLVTYVAETDGKLVGFCSFMESTPWVSGMQGMGYLDLLNVHPDYHGRSIGRKLLQATIKRSVAEGWTQQTLGTWSGNEKSVPAYKKTGHFWRPDSSVWMENFIPGALQMPFAQGFFSRHDWYTCYAREIDQEEDDQRWEGIKVYKQHWEAGDESLSIWIDREAGKPMAVEDGDLLVAVIPQEPEPLKGRKTEVHWRIKNKTDTPKRVRVQALGGDGLEIDHVETFTAPAGLSVEHVARAMVTASAPHTRDDGRAPAVRSIITIGHHDVELFAGLRPKQPLSVSTWPEQLSLPVNQTSKIDLLLHSELPKEETVTLRLMPPEGLALDWTEQELTIDAEGYCALPLDVTPTQERVYSLPVSVISQDGELPPLAETLDVYALEAGGLLAKDGDKNLRLETDRLRVQIEAKAGAIKVYDKEDDRYFGQLLPNIGPPYRPRSFQHRPFKMTLDERDGRAIVDMQVEEEKNSGLFLHQRFALASNGAMTLRLWMENRGGQPFKRRLLAEYDVYSDVAQCFTAPLPSGLVHTYTDLYPRVEEDLPLDPADLVEPWVAFQGNGLTAGLAWTEDWERIERFHSLRLTGCEIVVNPGECSRPLAITFSAGRGSWQRVREAALQWTGSSKREELALRPLVVAKVEPDLIVTTKRSCEAQLIVDSASARIVPDVKVTVSSQEGLQSSMARRELETLQSGHGLQEPIELTVAEESPRSYRGQVSLRSAWASHRSSFRVLKLGSDHPVEVSTAEEAGQTVWQIDNGLCRFEVAPGFGPSLKAWYWQGENLLWSFFPKTKPFAWDYPYFGGLHSILRPTGSDAECDLLNREEVTAEPITLQDAKGLTWTGLRLSVRPTKRELRDLLVELDYLTLGQSPMLKHVFRVHNLRAAGRSLHPEVALNASLGAGRQELTLHGEGFLHRPQNWGTYIQEQPWGALSHAPTGRTLILVSPENIVGLYDVGQEGCMLTLDKRFKLSPRKTRTLTTYALVAESYDEALNYRLMHDYEG